MLKTILVATDGSNHAKRAVELASDLADKYKAKLIALHIVSHTELPPGDRHLAEIEFADELKKYPGAGSLETVRGYGKLGMQAVVMRHGQTDKLLHDIIGKHLLKRTKRDVQKKGVKQIETVLEDGDPASKILEIAKKRNADLIVLGSRGLSGLGGLFMGSVSNKVNHSSDISVITVK